MRAAVYGERCLVRLQTIMIRDCRSIGLPSGSERANDLRVRFNLSSHCTRAFSGT